MKVKKRGVREMIGAKKWSVHESGDIYVRSDKLKNNILSTIFVKKERLKCEVIVYQNDEGIHVKIIELRKDFESKNFMDFDKDNVFVSDSNHDKVLVNDDTITIFFGDVYNIFYPKESGDIYE